MGTTVWELALIRYLTEKKPKTSQLHLRALLCILKEKNTYFSIKEIEQKTLIENGKLKRIMNFLHQNRIVEMDGCLYKKPAWEKLAGML